MRTLSKTILDLSFVSLFGLAKLRGGGVRGCYVESLYFWLGQVAEGEGRRARTSTGSVSTLNIRVLTPPPQPLLRPFIFVDFSLAVLLGHCGCASIAVLVGGVLYEVVSDSS